MYFVGVGEIVRIKSVMWGVYIVEFSTRKQREIILRNRDGLLARRHT